MRQLFPDYLACTEFLDKFWNYFSSTPIWRNDKFIKIWKVEGYVRYGNVKVALSGLIFQLKNKVEFVESIFQKDLN